MIIYGTTERAYEIDDVSLREYVPTINDIFQQINLRAQPRE